MRQTPKILPSLTKNMPKAMVVSSTLINVSERRGEGDWASAGPALAGFASLIEIANRSS